MAAEAVRRRAGVRGFVAGLAFGAVEGGGVAYGVFVGVVAGGTGESAGLVAAAHDEAKGLEADVEGIVGGARGREAVAGGAEFDLGAGCELGGRRDRGARSGVSGGLGVTAIASDSGLDDGDAGSGGEASMAVEAGTNRVRGLRNAERGSRRAGGAGGVAEGEVKLGGTGVVADTVFEPAAVDEDDGGDALVARA